MIYFLIVLFIFVIDYVFKYIINKKFPLNKEFNIYKNKISIYHIKNNGLAYGVFKKFQKIIFIGMSISILIIFGLFCFFLNDNSKLKKLALSFAFGGALGNYYDRLKNKCVTDFIYIKYKNAPVYNIADFFLILSPILLTIKYIKDIFTKK